MSRSTLLMQEAARLLRRTLNCSLVADWLNDHGVQPGRCCRVKVWDGKMVRRVFGNPLLKGLPQRGRFHCIKHHERGRRVSVKNPKGPNYYAAPHLAILEVAEFDELNEALAAQNSKLGRPQAENPKYSPRRSKFPSRTARCWYCGFHYVWGAHGQVDHLQCSATREWHCWNSVGLDGGLLAQKVVDFISSELKAMDAFADQFRTLVEQASQRLDHGSDRQLLEVEAEAAKLATDRSNLERTILDCGPRPRLNAMLDELDERERQLRAKRARIERTANRPLNLPSSPAEVLYLFEQEMRNLTIDSYEFADLLREIVTSCHVYLVRLVDGGHLLPRAKLTLNLGAVAADVGQVPSLQDMLLREVTIDVFEPPQRERIRLEVLRLAAEHPDWSQRQIAAALPEKPEQTAMWRALQLDRKMRALGLTSPYVRVTEPPTDCGKLRRHMHPRYEFRPLGGYERPPLDEPLLP